MVRFMKNKYEEFNVVIFFLIITFILEIILFISLININISTYKVFSGVISNDNCISLLVDKKELEILRDNKRLFFNNKTYDYEIESIDRESIDNYILVNIKTKIKTKKSVINVSILDNKISVIKIFKIIWKE